MAYNPKNSSVTINYVVKKTGDPFFLAGTIDTQQFAKYSDYITHAWGSCQELSPKGVEKVAA
jgi:hypothetical protein